MNAADAIYARFSDTFVPSASLATLTGELCDRRGGSDIGTIIARHALEPEPAPLAQFRPDVDRAFDRHRVATLRQELVPDSGLLIGAAGRLEPVKGFDVLIE